jgi:hypothetical protein
MRPLNLAELKQAAQQALEQSRSSGGRIPWSLCEPYRSMTHPNVILELITRLERAEAWSSRFTVKDEEHVSGAPRGVNSAER